MTMNNAQKTSDTYTHSSGQQIRLGDMFTSVSNHANSHGRLYIVTSLWFSRGRWRIKMLDIEGSREHVRYAHEMIDNRWMNKVT